MRSRAFAKAILLARPYTLSPERLEKLLREASHTVARLPKQPFQESWAYLHAMLRLLRAFQLGEDRAVPPKALLSIVAAVAYLVDPNDFIPDEDRPRSWVSRRCHHHRVCRRSAFDPDDFMTWELPRSLKK